MAKRVIETEKLCCQIGRRQLLKDIDWRVEAGEHYSVFGLNGCGKTTLLSIIAGYRLPTSGTVRVLGEPFQEAAILAQRKRIGWVSSSFFDQYYTKEPALYIVLSGKTGGLGLDHALTEADVKQAKALLAAFGLAAQTHQPYVSMSKGERQNVLIARALLAEPELLILDEPCSGLDVLARERVLGTVEKLARSQSMTVIYVTHHTEEILEVFEHTLLMANGRVYACGATEELFTESVIGDFLKQPVKITRKAGRIYLSADIADDLTGLLERGRSR